MEANSSAIMEDTNLAWIDVVTGVHISIMALGVINNMVASVVFWRDQQLGQSSRLILQSLSVVDMLTCTVGLLQSIFLRSNRCDNGFQALDLLICHLGYSYYLFWYLVGVSSHTTAFLSLDRYLAVCQPLRYSTFTPGRVKLITGILHLLAAAFAIVLLTHVKLEDGICRFTSSTLGRSFSMTYGVVIAIVYSIAPCLIMVLLYGFVIHSLRKQQCNLAARTVRPLSNITKELTWTALIIAIVFFIKLLSEVIFLNLDALYFEESFSFGVPLPQLGVVIAAFKPVINPVVYAIFLPVYRRSLFLTCSPRTTTEPEPQ